MRYRNHHHEGSAVTKRRISLPFSYVHLQVHSRDSPYMARTSITLISYLITFVYTQGTTKREEKRGIEWSIIRSWAVIINDPYGESACRCSCRRNMLCR